MAIAAVSRPPGTGVDQGFEELFREHHRLVYRTAYSVTGSRQDAEDVLQSVFLQLLRRDRARDLTVNPAGYLYRAAVNLSLNVVRSRKREQILHEADSVLVAVAEAGPGPDPGPDADLRRHLLAAIRQLRPRAVEILVLHYVHAYSDRQIAQMLGTSRGVVAVTLYRTRARLRQLMLRAIAGEDR